MNPLPHPGHEWLPDADAVAYVWCVGKAAEFNHGYEINYEVQKSHHPPGWSVVRRIADNNGANVLATYDSKLIADDVADHLTRSAERECRG